MATLLETLHTGLSCWPVVRHCSPSVHVQFVSQSQALTINICVKSTIVEQGLGVGDMVSLNNMGIVSISRTQIIKKKRLL